MFSEKITELRKSRGLTQKAFAEALNVEQQTVSKWECGKGVPDVTILIDIAKKFQVSLDEMLEINRAPEAEEAAETARDCIENDFKEISEKFVKDGLLDINALIGAFGESEYSYAAVERAVNAYCVTGTERSLKAIGEKDYKYILERFQFGNSIYSDILKHLLADDTEYVDYQISRHYCVNREAEEEKAAELRKSFLIRYAMRISEKHGETADGEELKKLVERGQVKKFIERAFERLVFKLRAKYAYDGGADELLQRYLEELDCGCDMDGDYYETSEHSLAALMCECREAVHACRPLPQVSPEELFGFIELIEEV